MAHAKYGKSCLGSAAVGDIVCEKLFSDVRVPRDTEYVLIKGGEKKSWMMLLNVIIESTYYSNFHLFHEKNEMGLF